MGCSRKFVLCVLGAALSVAAVEDWVVLSTSGHDCEYHDVSTILQHGFDVRGFVDHMIVVANVERAHLGDLQAVAHDYQVEAFHVGDGEELVVLRVDSHKDPNGRLAPRLLGELQGSSPDLRRAVRYASPTHLIAAARSYDESYVPNYIEDIPLLDRTILDPASKRRQDAPHMNCKPSDPVDPTILAMVADVSRVRLRDNVNELSNTFNSRLSIGEEIDDAQKWLATKFGDLGLNVSTYDYRELYDYPPNTFGDIVGTQFPDSYVIIGSHLDSRQQITSDGTLRAPGADDDGSGISMLLELAGIMRRHQYQHTIRFAGWTGEEQGLRGSRAYADYARANNIAIRAVLNADMIGYKPQGYPLQVGFKDRSVSIELTSQCMECAMKYAGIPSAFSNSCCSDYLPFYDNGYSAVGFFENNLTASANPNYHRHTDTFEYLDYELAEKISQAVLASAAELAVVA